MYIWQLDDWQSGDTPAFHWQEPVLRPLLDTIAQHQKHLLASHTFISKSQSGEAQKAQLDALVQNALRTSEIEGETLNLESVRSSVINRLGMDNAGQVKGSIQTDALAALLIEATMQPEREINLIVLCQWQSALFPDPEANHTLGIGQLRSEQPMQVISGRLDRPTVHFEAPPRDTLDAELQRFIHWFNQPPDSLDMSVRAAIAHLWFVTLHPFDDGNGRVTRALTDRALAQAEDTSIRYYSHSAAIMTRRQQYYDTLELSQRSTLDITSWLEWFLTVLIEAMQQGQMRFERVIGKTRFWQQHAQTALTDRQIKVLNRLLDTWGEQFVDGINASKYMSVAKVSKATATRELADLVKKQCLVKQPGGGRSTRYAIASAGPESGRSKGHLSA